MTTGVSTIKRVALSLGAALLFCGFCALGTWQLFRLHWKLDLIERVETRVHASPVSPPEPRLWLNVKADTDEYTRVVLRGHFLPKYNTYTQAVSSLGSGYWLLTPMKTDSGFLVWINRGFLPSQIEDPLLSQPRSDSQRLEVVGLLRITEPVGGFLRRNDSTTNRWYSRDIAALNVHHHLRDSAPYFIDAALISSIARGETPNLSSPQPSLSFDDTGEGRSTRLNIREPVPGLTVLVFKNNHLMYALTWYALAMMVAGVSLWLIRRGLQNENQ